MAYILDAPLTDIHVKCMKPTKIKKIIKPVDTIENDAKAIADWILNTEVVKRVLPDKIQKLINKVKNTKYSKKPVYLQNEYILKETGNLTKLSRKKILLSKTKRLSMF